MIGEWQKDTVGGSVLKERERGKGGGGGGDTTSVTTHAPLGVGVERDAPTRSVALWRCMCVCL